MSKKIICPLLKKPCIEHECAWFVNIQGMHPQTGAQLDTWDCSIKWTPIMMIESARQTRGVQAAVETMRNDVVDRQDNLNQALVLGAKMMKENTVKSIGSNSDVLPKLEG